MSDSSLSSPREALSQLLALTDEYGSPLGPTVKQGLTYEKSRKLELSNRITIQELINRLRATLEIEELPTGEVSFSEWLSEGEEEYHLRYYLSQARPSGRRERIIGQIDAGKVFALKRHLPADPGDKTSEKGSLTVEVQKSHELESGATIEDTIKWTEEQLGPVEFGTVVGFLRPVVDLLEREKQ